MSRHQAIKLICDTYSQYLPGENLSEYTAGRILWALERAGYIKTSLIGLKAHPALSDDISGSTSEAPGEILKKEK